MKYSDGKEAQLGDVVRFANGATGIVVASIDAEAYSATHPREQWSYLEKGIMVDCSDAGLIHYLEPEAGMTLVRRANRTQSAHAMQPLDESRMRSILETEIARITQPDLVALVQSLRVPLRCEPRPWDYGSPGDAYSCWIVLEHSASNTAIAYCEEGFGRSSPWGLLFLTDHPNMGMDSQWFVTLEDAVRESMAWGGENPPGY